VKLRYFQSLGMNKPPQMASSVPNFSSTQLKPKKLSRARTKTSPTKIPPDLLEEESRKRATSTPIPIGMQNLTIAVPIPSSGTGSRHESFHSSDDEINNKPYNSEEEEDFEEIEEQTISFLSTSLKSTSPENGKFVPPHEMLKKTHGDFNVGTAQSVAVWEQRRRQYI